MSSTTATPNSIIASLWRYETGKTTDIIEVTPEGYTSNLNRDNILKYYVIAVKQDFRMCIKNLEKKLYDFYLDPHLVPRFLDDPTYLRVTDRLKLAIYDTIKRVQKLTGIKIMAQLALHGLCTEEKWRPSELLYTTYVIALGLERLGLEKGRQMKDAIKDGINEYSMSFGSPEIRKGCLRVMSQNKKFLEHAEATAQEIFGALSPAGQNTSSLATDKYSILK